MGLTLTVWPRSLLLRLRKLREKRLRVLPDFFRRVIVLVRGNRPFVAKRVSQLAVTPECPLHGVHLVSIPGGNEGDWPEPARLKRIVAEPLESRINTG